MNLCAAEEQQKKNAFHLKSLTSIRSRYRLMMNIRGKNNVMKAVRCDYETSVCVSRRG